MTKTQCPKKKFFWLATTTLDLGLWAISYAFTHPPLSSAIEQKFFCHLPALLADENTLSCFRNVVNAHIHTVITAVEHHILFSLSA